MDFVLPGEGEELIVAAMGAMLQGVLLQPAPLPDLGTLPAPGWTAPWIRAAMRGSCGSCPGAFEAPNWTRDGAAFLFNSGGRIYRLPVTGGKPIMIDTGFADRCNNDHGISPDSNSLAISDQSQEEHRSIVYIVPIGGGTPRRITQCSPSYWHGWSPDGRTLAFVGERNGDFDIYAIPAAGGNETRLTTAKGLDDGPEYSPEGKYIYFNSERTGMMQIWRMRPDGSEQEQITSDDFNNWFPHISPDGKWMVLLSYDKSVTGHPESKDVMLRLMSLSDKKITCWQNFSADREQLTFRPGRRTVNVWHS